MVFQKYKKITFLKKKKKKKKKKLSLWFSKNMKKLHFSKKKKKKKSLWFSKIQKIICISTLFIVADESKRVVEVSVSSYHGANAFREDLVHGFILVYSSKRKASLSALKAFSANIPNLPIQVLAVTESGSASAFFGSELTQQLMTEGW